MGTADYFLKKGKESKLNVEKCLKVWLEEFTLNLEH